MPYTTPDYRQVRADILRDIANQQPGAYTGEDSDFAVRANAAASAIEGLYQHQQWIVRQVFPDTADSDYLERHAGLHGVTRKAATAAAGTITFSGTAGSAVPIGTETKTNSGVAFVTTAAGEIGGGGTATIAASASAAGAAGNQAAATALTLTAAPSGVLSAASIAAMTGGTDVETDAELLARLLQYLRMPPVGGAKHDYYLWAMSVAGVMDAYVYPQRRALNSVDVVIETSGGLPSQQLLDDVLAYIDQVRPVCVDLLVIAPQLVTVDVTATLTLSGTTLADATARINATLAAFFSGLHVGDAVKRSKLIALMMDTPGVIDVTLTVPAANVQPLVDVTHSELAAPGTVTLS